MCIYVYNKQKDDEQKWTKRRRKKYECIRGLNGSGQCLPAVGDPPEAIWGETVRSTGEAHYLLTLAFDIVLWCLVSHKRNTEKLYSLNQRLDLPEIFTQGRGTPKTPPYAKIEKNRICTFLRYKRLKLERRFLASFAFCIAHWRFI